MRTFQPLMLCAALIAVVSACRGTLETDAPEERIFRACFPESAVKTVLAADGTTILWQPGDAIRIFQGSASGTFVTGITQASDQATFVGTLEGGADAESDYWAVWPADAAGAFDGQSVTLSLPARQDALEGSFSDFPSVARSRDMDLYFYNVCGGVAFSLVHEGITQVTLRSNAGEPIAGTVRVGWDADGRPAVLEVQDGSSSIVLDAPSGGVFRPGVRYFIAALPGHLSHGYTLSFQGTEDMAPYGKEAPLSLRRACFRLVEKADETLPPDNPDDPDDPGNPDDPDDPGGGDDPESLVTVSTRDADQISATQACLNGFYSGADGGVYDHGFFYGTSPSALIRQTGLNSLGDESASFQALLSSLEPGTTYYFRAYVTVWDAASGAYADILGEVLSFATDEDQEVSFGSTLPYLGCYEMPALSLANPDACTSSGQEAFGDTRWYCYNTTSAQQRIVTHTYSYGGAQLRNWTALVDKDKKAPLWNAFVMHNGAYPRNNTGRSGSWTEDPALPSSWQQSSAGSGYSRGHFVASNYRQACSDANKQTFYYTNQALQWQDGFNSGIWSSLESAVVSHAPTGRDTLYVVVGVLYEDNKTVGGVPVPSHFYKCLMQCSFNASGTMTDAKGVAYLFENRSYSGNAYGSYATSIDAVEERSGWDFFANVPKGLQDAAERRTTGIW